MSKFDLLSGGKVEARTRYRIFLRQQKHDRMGWIRSVQLLGRSYPMLLPRDIAPDFGDIFIESSIDGDSIKRVILVGDSRKVIAKVTECEALADGSFLLDVRSDL